MKRQKKCLGVIWLCLSVISTVHADVNDGLIEYHPIEGLAIDRSGLNNNGVELVALNSVNGIGAQDVNISGVLYDLGGDLDVDGFDLADLLKSRELNTVTISQFAKEYGSITEVATDSGCKVQLTVNVDNTPCFVDRNGLLLSATMNRNCITQETLKTATFHIVVEQLVDNALRHVDTPVKTWTEEEIRTIASAPVDNKWYFEHLLPSSWVDAHAAMAEMDPSYTVGFYFDAYNTNNDRFRSPDFGEENTLHRLTFSRSSQVSQTSDNPPPTAEIERIVRITNTEDVEGAPYRGIVEFHIKASDNDLEQVSLHIARNEPGGDRVIRTWTKVDGEEDFVVSYYVSQLEPRDDYIVYADAYDQAGNRSLNNPHIPFAITRGEYNTLESAIGGFAHGRFLSPKNKLAGEREVQGIIRFRAVLADDFQPERATFHVAGPRSDLPDPAAKDRHVKIFSGPEVETSLSYDYDTSQLASGEYIVYFDAYQNFGQPNQERFRSFNRIIKVTNRDRTSSTVGITKKGTRAILPHRSKVLSGETVFHARVRDEFEPIRAGFHLVRYPNGPDQVVCSFGDDAITLDSIFECKYDVGQHEPGQYIFYFDAYDAQGNRERTSNVNLRISGRWLRPRVMYDHDYSHIVNIPSFWEHQGDDSQTVYTAKYQDKPNRWNWAAHKLLKKTEGCVDGASRCLDMDVFDQLIRNSVAEVANSHVDTLVFSSGTGEVPLWKSKYYPLSLHDALWRVHNQTEWGIEGTENLGAYRGPMVKYLEQGGNALQVALAAAQPTMQFFVSFRMNDKHFTHVDLNPNHPSSFQNVSYFLQNGDPHKLLGNDDSRLGSGYQRLLDFAECRDRQDDVCPMLDLELPGTDEISAYVNHLSLSETEKQTLYGMLEKEISGAGGHLLDPVAKHKQALIKDLVAENPCIDGLVLDFMRIPHLFNQTETTVEKRNEIMVELIAATRVVLDETRTTCSVRYNYRPLAVHIPYFKETYPELGIDLERWALAGVDMFIFGFERDWAQPLYYRPGADSVDHLIDFSKVKAELGEVATYQHINYATQYREVTRPPAGTSGADATAVDCSKEIDGRYHTERESPYLLRESGRSCSPTYSSRRRTSKEEMVSGAYAAYTRGADGVFLFNMPYYRGGDGIDPEQWAQPPFSVMRCLGEIFEAGSGGALSTQCDSEYNGPHYFVSESTLLDDQALAGRRPLPLNLPPGQLRPVAIYTPEPPDGWPFQMLLHVEFELNAVEDPVNIWLNGHYLGIGGTNNANAWKPADFTWISREQDGNSYRVYCPSGDCSFKCATGSPENRRTYVVHSQYLRNGRNNLVFERIDDNPGIQRIERIDLVPR